MFIPATAVTSWAAPSRGFAGESLQMAVQMLERKLFSLFSPSSSVAAVRQRVSLRSPSSPAVKSLEGHRQSVVKISVAVERVLCNDRELLVISVENAKSFSFRDFFIFFFWRQH